MFPAVIVLCNTALSIGITKACFSPQSFRLFFVRAILPNFMGLLYVVSFSICCLVVVFLPYQGFSIFWSDFDPIDLSCGRVMWGSECMCGCGVCVRVCFLFMHLIAIVFNNFGSLFFSFLFFLSFSFFVLRRCEVFIITYFPNLFVYVGSPRALQEMCKCGLFDDISFRFLSFRCHARGSRQG